MPERKPAHLSALIGTMKWVHWIGLTIAIVVGLLVLL
jgi:hypothetical protein